HRVYKNYDPRTKIMQRTCHEVLTERGIKDDPLLDVAMELERIALHDDYFIEKKLYPNIDFYSGITLKAMGFPTAMFTVLVAVALERRAGCGLRRLTDSIQLFRRVSLMPRRCSGADRGGFPQAPTLLPPHIRPVAVPWLRERRQAARTPRVAIGDLACRQEFLPVWKQYCGSYIRPAR